MICFDWGIPLIVRLHLPCLFINITLNIYFRRGYVKALLRTHAVGLDKRYSYCQENAILLCAVSADILAAFPLIFAPMPIRECQQASVQMHFKRGIEKGLPALAVLSLPAGLFSVCYGLCFCPVLMLIFHG